MTMIFAHVGDDPSCVIHIRWRFIPDAQGRLLHSLKMRYQNYTPYFSRLFGCKLDDNEMRSLCPLFADGPHLVEEFLAQKPSVVHHHSATGKEEVHVTFVIELENKPYGIT